MSEITLNKEAFRYALSNFGKGEIFEEFAHSFLCFILSDNFIPVGGTKDKGVDGSMRLLKRNIHPTFIYQISTEVNYKDKIEDSISKLLKNKIKTDQLVYVTSRKINDKNNVEDQFLAKYKIPLRIFDVEWFVSNVVNDERLVLLYETYIESNIHEFQKPDKQYIVGNFIKDPRLFVFMRQQFNASKSSLEIENKLADTLILYGLEGTASETKTLRTDSEIKTQIAQLVKFNPQSIHQTIDSRLKVLSKKPRQINHHYDKSPTIIKRAIRNYTEKLMSTPSKNNKKLISYFDEEMEKILKEHIS